jgi:hypothetical protein
MADISPITVAHFWSRVKGGSDFDCWPWQGRTNDRGYGRFGREMAHRVAFELVSGPIPDDRLIRHRCDNPICCNPKHLEPGTHLDNSRDCVTRRRIARGATHGMSKITEEQARYIRTNPDGLRCKELALKFGVAESTVSYIRSGKSWKYLGEGDEGSSSEVVAQSLKTG